MGLLFLLFLGFSVLLGPSFLRCTDEMEVFFREVGSVLLMDIATLTTPEP